MMSHRCRHQERGSVLSRCLTSSTERWATARVTLAISFLLLAGNSHLLYSITECGLVLDLLGLARGHKHAWMTLFLFADVRCEVLNVVGFGFTLNFRDFGMVEIF